MSAPMIFLKISIKGKPILGDGQVKDHLNEIACEDIDWAITTVKPGKDAQGNARSVAQPKEVELTKFIDRASPNLYGAMLRRDMFTTATITMVAPMMTGNTRTFPKLMTLQLFDGFVQRIDVSASGGGKAMKTTEKLTLNYQKCKLMYYPTNRATGGREAPTSFEMVLPKYEAHRA
jgi:type VI secretion system Hcp family effector